ncbi:hypothetical protein RyT2_24630 [Pseudolactococcus yaeyamensis]
MKNIFKGIRNFFAGQSVCQKQADAHINLEVLANLELAHSFNHAIYLHFNEKNGNLMSLTGSISNITERQVVVKDLQSNQIRFILLSKIRKVTFVLDNVRRSMIDQKNA